MSGVRVRSHNDLSRQSVQLGHHRMGNTFRPFFSHKIAVIGETVSARELAVGD